MRKLIIANWKMNPVSQKEALKLAFKKKTKREVVFCAPFPYLCLLKGLSLAAQDCFWQEKGPFTGEVSPLMLKNLKVKYVLIGHSERRALGETDEEVSKKTKAVLKAGLTPVLCIGENLEQRRKGKAFSVVEKQVKKGLDRVAKASVGKVIFAYEPIWAIGSGMSCSLEDVLTMILFLRKLLSRAYKKKKLRILYGGSVDSLNAKEYLSSDWIDGLLVGHSSLDKKEFSKIVKS